MSGYHAAKLLIYDDLMRAGGLTRPNVLNMLNTKYLIGPPGMERGGLAPLNAGRQVAYRNEEALPKAWWVDRVRTVDDATAALRAVLDPRFDPEGEAVLISGADLEPPTARPEVPPRLTEYDFHKIVIETETTRPAFMVLSEVFYPLGWQATIDDKPVQIHRTDFVLRGVSVPAGSHRVVMTFGSAAFRWGGLLTWTLFPLLILVIAEETWRERRRRSRKGPEE